ncbi:sugar transferase [Diaminobutyricibacter sp. McL0608]|uniref:sugar transferase n=1 Tax=Leifsonia sp. McL0608 TaxID=3143537 RepID=UPI0031F320F2
MASKPYDLAKRMLDLVSASVLLVLTSPIQLAVGVAVAAKLGRPVLFRQVRPGLHGRSFTLIKFRSMKDVDVTSGLVTDAERLTRFGRALRATSLDELPTLVNVVRGDMSMVGPRPLLIAYLTRYTPEQARRHEVRPGITGLAQVSGRNDIDWDDKLRLDVEYVDTRGLRLDASIIWRTLSSVVRREGISAEGHATTHEFIGSDRGDRA